ncbi:MAG: hypothetical protein LBE09_08750, partial [Christensenellaceae bacterium]|nr:hypothetical protein [Christensenellaceae bacterium]
MKLKLLRKHSAHTISASVSISSNTVAIGNPRQSVNRGIFTVSSKLGALNADSGVASDSIKRGIQFIQIIVSSFSSIEDICISRREFNS